MSVVGDRVWARFHEAKPFWQTTDEMIERLSADGQAYTEHQHRAEEGGQGSTLVRSIESSVLQFLFEPANQFTIQLCDATT